MIQMYVFYLDRHLGVQIDLGSEILAKEINHQISSGKPNQYIN